MEMPQEIYGACKWISHGRGGGSELVWLNRELCKGSVKGKRLQHRGEVSGTCSSCD